MKEEATLACNKELLKNYGEFARINEIENPDTLILFLTADNHLTDSGFSCRTDNIWETQFKKMKQLLSHASQEKAIILIAGDLCDKPRSWKLLPELITLFRQFNVPIYSVFGQHCTYLYSESTRSSTNLGILNESGLVTIPNKEMITLKDDIKIYGCNYGEEIPVPENKDHFNILLIHKEIGPNFSLPSIVLRENKNYNLICCGDIHSTFIEKDKERILLNPGPMLRKTSDLFSHKPCYFRITIDKNKKITVDEFEFIHTSYDECMKINTEQVKSEGSIELLDEFFESLQNINSKGTDFIFVLQELLRKFNGSDGVRKILSSLLLEKGK